MAAQLQLLLQGLRDRVARMTAGVQHVSELAIDAVLSADVNQARLAIEADKTVDSEEVEIERYAIDLLARQQPTANDLRFITSVIKVNSDFERIADCAVNAAQRAPALARRRDLPFPADLTVMARALGRTLRDTINAFNLADRELAQQVLTSDDAIDAFYQTIVQDTIAAMEGGETDASRHLAIVMIAKNFERMGDHCTNIAEDIIYIHSGQIVRHQRQAV